MQENKNEKPIVHEVNVEEAKATTTINNQQKTAKGKNKKNRLVSNLLLVIAIGLFAVAGYLVFNYFNNINTQKQNGVVALREVDQVIDTGIAFETLPPEGSALGKMEIVGLTGQLPILEGENDQLVLARGVGHLNGSGLPGQNRQIFLSAHRETFFVQLKNAKVGDIVRITMPEGVYDYKISHTKIVHETEGASVINGAQLDRDELVLMTCYPFNYWDSANERYLVFAYPVE